MPAFQLVILLLEPGKAGRTKNDFAQNSGPGKMKMDSTSYDRLVNNTKRSFGETLSRTSLSDVLRVARKATARRVYHPLWTCAGCLLIYDYIGPKVNIEATFEN